MEGSSGKNNFIIEWLDFVSNRSDDFKICSSDKYDLKVFLRKNVKGALEKNSFVEWFDSVSIKSDDFKPKPKLNLVSTIYLQSSHKKFSVAALYSFPCIFVKIMY